ncbi:hypothetical protein GCM10009547_12090 [Sporichthya brevicatena]|uniref:DUF2516 family protein n=1 Tax=Sporichthya brevicatena TaxID=171442 RepID=A0ABN1GHF8_9ACTN
MGVEIWFLPPESAAGLGTLALFALHLYAFLDCLIRPTNAFVAAGKKTKQFWLILTGVASGCTLLLSNVTFTFVIAATVIALIYILDVRPAVQTYRGPRGGGGRKPRGTGGW